MDRLFSKFQLGDIKVNEKSTFPPDAPDAESYQDPPPPPPAAATTAAGGEETPWRPAELPAERPPAPPVEPVPAVNAAPDQAAVNGVESAPGPTPGHDVGREDRVVEVNTRPYRPGYGQGAAENRGDVLKVSAKSRPSAVAGAIAGVVRENGRAEVQAIGAGAANQAIKAVAIARDYLNETGIEAVCLPSLVDLTIDDADRTAIRLVVETR